MNLRIFGTKNAALFPVGQCKYGRLHGVFVQVAETCQLRKAVHAQILDVVPAHLSALADIESGDIAGMKLGLAAHSFHAAGAGDWTGLWKIACLR